MDREEIQNHVNSLLLEKDKKSKKAVKFFKHELSSEGVLEVLHNSFYNHADDRIEGINHKYLYALSLVLHKEEERLIPYLYDAFKASSQYDALTQDMALKCWIQLLIIPDITITYHHSSNIFISPFETEYTIPFEDLFERLLVIFKANGKINALHALEALVNLNKYPEYIIPDLPNVDVIELDKWIEKFAKAQNYTHVLKFKEDNLENRKKTIMKAFNAMTLKSKGDIQGALQLMDGLIKEDPYCDTWYYNKAYMIMDQDPISESAKISEEIIQRAYKLSGYQKTANYLVAMAKSARLLGKLEEASNYLKLPIKLYIPKNNYTPIELWDFITSCYNREKQLIAKLLQAQKYEKKQAKFKLTPSANKIIKPPQVKKNTYCKHCGKINDSDSKFCKHCGKQISI